MKLQIALCQMKVTDSKEENWKKAGDMAAEAAARGAEMVVLPEMWNCPYSNDYFPLFAEREGGETMAFLSETARSRKLWIIGGSIPEREGDRVYNTSYSFDPAGKLIGKHRKVHLFDIDIAGGIRFMESETLTAGDRYTLIETGFGRVGIAICFDVRFPEMFRSMALAGAELIVVPGAFNMTTGPAHWELTMRARALDNQVYVAACSPARDTTGPYVAYGNSCVANPWGELCGKADASETIVTAQLDSGFIRDIREQLPLLKARRPQVYGNERF